MSRGLPKDAREHQTLILQDGRKLGFAEFGDRGGEAIFYFHGWPGSRLEAGVLASVADFLGVRVIAADRPGYGLSDDLCGRTIASFADDIDQLANALGLSRFALLGVSGGAPYALGCSARLTTRVTRVALVCGLGSLGQWRAAAGMTRLRRFACELLRRTPSMIRPFSWYAGRRIRRNADAMFNALIRALPAPDQAVLAAGSLRAKLLESFAEAVSAGVHGIARDLRLYFKPWDFELPSAGKIAFWHGELDVIVPLEMSRKLAAQIPGARLIIFPNDGHYSLPIGHMENILRSLREPVT